MIRRWNGHGMQAVNWHNAHLGVQGIIACNGPSFAREPVESLRGPARIVIGVNSTYPRLKPDYWHGVDTPDNFEASLCYEPFPKILRAGLEQHQVGGLPLAHLISTYFVELQKIGNVWDWSERSIFYESKNSLLSAVQLALWLGLRHLALVGVDLSHEKGDYADGNYLTERERAENRFLHDETVKFFAEFVPQAATQGVRFTVSNPQSRLAGIMPVRPIAEVIAACEAGVPHGRARLHNTRGLAPRQAKDGKLGRNVVLVLRSGGDFKPAHVHRMVRMLGAAVKNEKCKMQSAKLKKTSHLSPFTSHPSPLRITLLTDLTAKQFPGLTVVPLLHGWPGWWSKMEMYRPTIFPDEPFLYLDLDTTVRDLPDAYFAHPETVVLKQFRKGWAEHKPRQCGMMLLHPAERQLAWERWTQEPEEHMHRLAGDDDFWNLWMPPVATWQDLHPGEVTSWRFNWEKGRDYDGPLDKAKVKVICFFGKPRPWEVTGKEKRVASG